MINPKLKHLAVPINSIRPNPKNLRDHDDRNLEVIAASLEEFGQQTPIVTLKGVILKGNGTYEAAKKLGWKQIAAVEFDQDKEKAREYGITDNRASDLSAWDAQPLQTEIVDLRSAGWQAEKFGWTEDEIKALYGESEINEEPLDEGGELPATAVKGRQATGEIWELGPHRLMCADSTKAESWQALMNGEKAALVFTDPPYGVSYQDRAGKYGKIAGDEKRGDDLVNALLVPVFAQLAEHSTESAAFYIWHASATREDFSYAMKRAGILERQYLIWAKPQIVLGWADYRWAHEPCFYAAKSGNEPAFYGDRAQGTVWRVGYRTKKEATIVLANGLHLQDGKGGQITIEAAGPRRKLRSLRVEPGNSIVISDDQGRGDLWEVARESDTQHPTQKPVELARRAIMNSSKPEDIVVDPFLGSGCTLLGAETTNRICYGFELERNHCETIIGRWETMTGQKARLAGTGKTQPKTKAPERAKAKPSRKKG